MSDTSIERNFFQSIHELWIVPELDKRRAAAALSSGFQIFRCLIRLPHNQSPIVEFNDEISWLAEARRGDGLPFEEGTDVFLHEIQEITNVLPPEVNGQRVAFVFIYWDGYSYNGIFDFSPNWDDGVSPSSAREWSYGPLIANYLQSLLNERAVTREKIEEVLQQIGLWIAPALLPYPLAKIVKHIEEGEIPEARSLLISYCTPQFIRSLVEDWWSIPAFQARKDLIEEALHTHESRLFHSVIYTLLPQAEGVITDWEYSLNIEHSTIPFRTESKTKKFRDLILERPELRLADRKVIESAASFILDGPVLTTFKRWFDQTDLNFPNRNVIGHGRYEAALFNEENSIKTFLLLDTIHHIIAENNTVPKNT